MRMRGAMMAVAIWLCAAAGAGAAQRLVFVSNDGSAEPSVSAFTIGPSSALTAVAGSPFGTGATATGADDVVVTPDGSHLYVTNFGGNSVSGFSIGPSGALTLLPGSPWAAGSEPAGLAIAPGGRYLYATNVSSSDVTGYSVGSGGTLTALATTPLGTGQTAPGIPAITPDGAFLYVPDKQGVVAFAIGSNGSLSAAPGSPYALAGALQSPAAGVTPNGGELLVGMGYASGDVAAYAIAANGALTAVPGSPFTAASGLVGVPDLAVSPAGAAVYVDDAGKLAAMSIGAGGVLATLAGSPFAYPATPSTPQSVALAPGGGEVFADDPGNSVIQPYGVAAGGALTAIGLPVPTGGTAPDQGSITAAPDQGPTAAFTAAAPAPAGSASGFSATASTDSYASVALYAWSFGDGTTGASATPTITHTYAEPGTYTVTLTVTGSDGCSVTGPYTGRSPSCVADPAATASHTVTIAAPTATYTSTFGNQRVTLITAAASVCRAATTTLPVTLGEVKQSRGVPLRFQRAGFYIDRGLKRTRSIEKKIRRHGRTTVVKVKTTTYAANVTAMSLPAAESFSLAGLKPGQHTLTVKLTYSERERVTVKRKRVTRTVIVTKTISAKFSVC